MHRIFGTKENVVYFDRAGAYLIPVREGKIGVMLTPKGYFLPGGGVEDGETLEACLRRECLEEAGALPIVEARLCSAEDYVRHPAVGYFHPIQTYYVGELREGAAVPTEPNHSLLWFRYEEIKGKMFSPMQNWALEMAMDYYEKKGLPH